MNTRFFIRWYSRSWRGSWLPAACILLSYVVKAQLPYPQAHYPLLMEKYRHAYVLQAWDVSGNRKHGNTWDPVNKRYYESKGKGDYGFTGMPYLGFEFPTHDGPMKGMQDIRQKTTLLKKAPEPPEPGQNPGQNPNILHIDIPDPLPGLTSEFAPFTVCFWLYVADINTQQTLINTPHLGVWLKDQRIYVEHGSIAVGARSEINLVTSPNTWYFIAISAEAPDYLFYAYKLHDAEPVITQNDLPDFEFYVPLSENPRILGADFREGSICGVRFYNETLDEDELATITTEDVNFGSNALAPGTARVGEYHFIKRNMYSYFPFDKQASEPIDVMKKNAITRFGANDALTIIRAEAVAGRNGNDEGAIELSYAGRLTLKPFFGDYLDDYNSSTDKEELSHFTPKGFTVSFWVKLLEPVTSDKGVITPPFDDNTPRSRVFGLTDNSQTGTQNSPLIWGYSRINDRLCLRRYNEGINPTRPGYRYTWELWHYDPVAFSDAGWYHVVYSQYANWLKTYIYNPDGTPVCQAVYWEIQEALKNNPSTREWFIGSSSFEPTNNVPDLVLDDFKIFNWPLTPSETDALHESETQTSPVTAARGCNCSGAPELQNESADDDPGNILVYPNPATDKITINVKLTVEGTVQYKLTDLQGRLFRTGSQQLGKGRQLIQLEGLNLVSGLYILQVQGAGLNDTRKIMIQN